LSGEQLIQECENNQLKISETERGLPHLLLHAKVGAVYAVEKYGITDEDVLNAITYHTTGRPAMSQLEKIVYVADYIEPNRKPIPLLDKVREIAYQDIDEAIILILDRTLEYLNEKCSLIDPLTKETYDYYVNHR
jgi:predicted HD superfamily hydrolase involved in NAD metabolism